MLVLDGSILREPMSGVHYAVQQELIALATSRPQETLVLGRREFFPNLPNLHSIPAYTKHPAGRIFWQQCVLPRLLQELHADALFAPAYTAPLRTEVPVILQVHDLIALDRPDLCDTKNVLQMRLLLPKSIRRADAIVVPTQHVADRIAERFHRTDAIPLPMGADSHPTTSSLPSPHLRPYWLFLGNIEPKKGIPLLLDAYAESTPPCDLILVGRPAWKSKPILRKIRETRGPGEILRKGRVSDAEVNAYLQHAQALILPSIEEGCGLPLLEAIACGTPVVYSEHPALLETARGIGEHFPVGDARALRDCLARSYPRKPLSLPFPAPLWGQWAQFFWERVLF